MGCIAYLTRLFDRIYDRKETKYTFEGRGERMLRHLDQISLQLAENHNKKCLGLPVNNVLDFHWLYWSLWMLLHLCMYQYLIKEAK